MGLFNFLSKPNSNSWIKSASKKELQDAYEIERQKWAKNGAGNKTPLMNKLGKAISEISAKEWENDPRRNTDPNYRWTDKNRWEDD